MLFECVLLKVGNARFKVESAKMAFSKNGNEMLVLKIRIYDGDNQETVITEYMTGALFFKARALLRAAGMNIPHNDNKGEWGLLDFEGKHGKCIIDIDVGNGDFPPKNYIKSYEEPQKDAAPSTVAKPNEPTNEPTDDIPW